MKKYIKLAHTIDARLNCIKSNNTDWEAKHEETIETIIASLPHGSGIDGKTEFDYEYSTGERIKIYSEYHAMNENGYYDGWINFTITIRPSLMFGFTITVSGNFGKYADVKDYLNEIFQYDLDSEMGDPGK